MLSNHDDIEKEILDFYACLVGTNATELKSIDLPAIRNGKIQSANLYQKLIRPTEEKKIWWAMSNIEDTKAQGLDGFNALFFKFSWKVVKKDIIEAIMELFDTYKMFMVFNFSLITSIPKSPDAMTIEDMRLISCCNMIYKIISKIPTSRLGDVISIIIDDNQSTFISGRIIHDNIMMAQELVRGYGRKKISPICMVQMDIQKAYDMVEWTSLTQIMEELGFPQIFIKWIMSRVTTVSYRFSINGIPYRIIKNRIGLRQGDPGYPLLFVLIMEYFHRVMQGLSLNPNFNFHPKCVKLMIINMCFIDDTLMFVIGDICSMKLIMDEVRDFSAATDLNVSIPNSKIYIMCVCGRGR